MDANVSVKEFITIEELHRDPSAKRMAACAFAKSGCSAKARWMVSDSPMCTSHKDGAVSQIEEMLKNLTERPEGAEDEDMDLLELLWEEIEHEKRPNVLVAKVVKELSLKDSAAGRNLASWYLWYMGIINIHQRAATCEEQS